MSVNNQVFLIGRLTAQPEIKYLPNTGRPVTHFTLAVDRGYKKEDGSKETDFLDIVVWGKMAEVVANNLDKGRLVAVSGSIQTRKYKDKNGQNKTAFEILASGIQFLDYRKGNNEQNEEFTEVHNDDELPFK